MSWKLWWLFTTSEFALCLTPGPAVLFVIAQGLRRSFRSSVAANLGILSGNLIYFTLSAAGLSALVLAWPRAFAVLRGVGVLYLAWIGLAALFGKSSVLKLAATDEAETFRRVWLRGIVLQLANPKALVFFSAFLPPFVDPTHPVVPQMAILAVTSTVMEFFILAAYGALAGRASHLAENPAAVQALNRFSGAMLVIAAALTAYAGLR